MAFIFFFILFGKVLKKLELSPQNFRYGVLHLLYSGTMYVCRLTLSNKGDYQMYNNIVQKNFEVFATLQ